MNFTAIDFETANPDRSSICQVGIAEFEDGECRGSRSELVDPQSYFDPICVSVHGITKTDISDAPKFPEVYENVLGPSIAGEVVVCHTHFDRGALASACDRFAVSPPECQWLDSAGLARRTWRDVSRKGYGLRPLADRLGIEFRHHDAGEDARAAGLVVVAAAGELGLGLEDCMRRARMGIGRAFGDVSEPRPRRARALRSPKPKSDLEQILERAIEGAGANYEEPLEGESVVFTGRLSLPRPQLVEAVTALGGESKVDGASVTKKTTMLVMGTQDLERLGGKDKSSKHIKAEKIQQQGGDIQILGEDDFIRIIRTFV